MTYKFKFDRLVLYVVCFLLSLIVGLRGNTRDTIIYVNMYEELNAQSIFELTKIFNNYGMEYGFILLAWTIKILNLNHQVFFFLISLLTLIYLIKAADLLKINPIVVLLFYVPTFYLTQQFMQIRQGLASVVVFYGLIKIISDNKITLSSVCFFLIAALIHTVSIFIAILSVLIYFLRTIKNYTKITLILAIPFGTFLIARIISNYEIFIFIETIGNYYYSNEEIFSGKREFSSPPNLRALFLFIFFIIFRKYNLKIIHYDLLLLCFGISLGIRLGFYDFIILSGRLGVAAGFSEVYLLSLIYVNSNQKAIKKILIIIYMAIQLAIFFEWQAPFMIEDYFSEIG